MDQRRTPFAPGLGRPLDPAPIDDNALWRVDQAIRKLERRASKGDQRARQELRTLHAQRAQLARGEAAQRQAAFDALPPPFGAPLPVVLPEVPTPSRVRLLDAAFALADLDADEEPELRARAARGKLRWRAGGFYLDEGTSGPTFVKWAVESAAEAWEVLSTRGLIAPDWIGDPRRARGRAEWVWVSKTVQFIGCG